VFSLAKADQLLGVHSAGYPMITYFTQRQFSTLGGYNLGGINATGQIPIMSGMLPLSTILVCFLAIFGNHFQEPGIF
jgi:hypothetical protein